MTSQTGTDFRKEAKFFAFEVILDGLQIQLFLLTRTQLEDIRIKTYTNAEKRQITENNVGWPSLRTQ